jgi:thioredoxin reductase (NADPH)
MEFIWNSAVKRFEGEGHLDTVVLKNIKTDEEIPVKCDNCFEFIGYLPNTEIFKEQIKMTGAGYILTNEKMETNIEGVFAAGDVRDKWLKQVATAVGDGAIAGFAAEKYIAESEAFHDVILQKDKPGLTFIYNAVAAESIDFLLEIEKIENHFEGRVIVNRVDIYKSSGIADRLNVGEFPAVVLTVDGVVKERYIGHLDSAKIIESLEKICDACH